jgi:hypothetical protein
VGDGRWEAGDYEGAGIYEGRGLGSEKGGMYAEKAAMQMWMIEVRYQSA